MDRIAGGFLADILPLGVCEAGDVGDIDAADIGWGALILDYYIYSFKALIRHVQYPVSPSAHVRCSREWTVGFLR